MCRWGRCAARNAAFGGQSTGITDFDCSGDSRVVRSHSPRGLKRRKCRIRGAVVRLTDKTRRVWNVTFLRLQTPKWQSLPEPVGGFEIEKKVRARSWQGMLTLAAAVQYLPGTFHSLPETTIHFRSQSSPQRTERATTPDAFVTLATPLRRCESIVRVYLSMPRRIYLA